MTLKTLISRIQSKKINIKDKDDMKEIKKYFNDLPKTINKTLCKKIIKYWDEINIKIADDSGLDIILKYLDIVGENTDQKITIAGKYDFSYIDYEGDKIRQENIFKLNFRNIVRKLNEYFQKVNILIEFEKATTIDKKIKKPQATYKHDVIIKIISKDINEDDIEQNTYEIVLEYFEEIHNKFNDDDKKISADLFSDAYYVFNEKHDSMNEFMINTLYSIIELICASMNDPYELSKILHFNKNYKSKSYNKNISYFNKIIQIKKTDEVDFKSFYNDIKPINPETNDELSEEEFIEYIEEKYDIIIENHNATLFETLIMNLNNDISQSDILHSYKDIYLRAMNTLFSASQKIIDIMAKQRKKRLSLPEFIKNIQKFHKDNLKNGFC
jgi:hypothetical protein